MAIIDNSTNLIANIPMTDQGSTPTTPPAGLTRIYSKSDGLYIVNASGTTTGPFAASTGTMVGQDGWVSAGETWTYVSADGATGVYSVPADVTTKYSAGMKVKYTQTTVKYGIIMAVGAFGAGVTPITIDGGTDYTLANAAITAPYYSVVRAPQGFPMSLSKWSIKVADTTDRNLGSTPTANTWYNIGTQSISLRIGAWVLSYQVGLLLVAGSSAQWTGSVTLSTANNTESDKELTGRMIVNPTILASQFFNRSKNLSVAARTVYYLNSMTASTGLSDIYNNNGSATLVIEAVNAYL